jgi:hypothetical protein
MYGHAMLVRRLRWIDYPDETSCIHLFYQSGGGRKCTWTL